MGDDAAWKQLGEALKERRAALGYTNLARFCRDRGIEYRTAIRLEKGEKGSYAGVTLLAADAAYGFQPGSCAAFTEGGELIPIPDAGLLDGLSADDQKTVRAFIELMRQRAREREHS